jgi:PAS domain S-box-containing protein
MNFLDVRTVMFSQLITDALGAIVLAVLWLQNRKRYTGMFFWVVDFIFQTTAVLLIMLRGSLPAWLSMALGSALVIAGALVGYLGLERFIGKRSSQVHNYILLAVFILVHFFFIYVKNDLEARNLNLSLGLLIISFQCAWLMLERAGHGLTRMTQVVGGVFAFFCLTSLVRIFIIVAIPDRSNDFFQTGFYDTLILMTYQVLLILLTFALALMVNRRLLAEVKTQEEKFTKAFHSSPYAILITRLSDGLILDVNRGFEEMTGYLPSEVIGKTTLSLLLWVKETDRQEVVAELSARGEVQGREFQFRAKSGREFTGQFYAEILLVENEQLIFSSIGDITERNQIEATIAESEKRYRSLFENMLNGMAYCQMLFKDGRPDDFIYLTVNAAFEKQTGLKDVIGKKVSEVIPGIRGSDPGLIETYGRVALTGKPEAFETYVEALKMWFSISVYCPEAGYFVAVFDVITERKRTEEKLREDEARLHLALDAARGGAWEWNLQTNENIWSEELWKVYGLEPHSCEPSYEAWLQTIHPDDRAGAAQAVQEAAREAIELKAEWRVLDPGGVEHWVMSRGQPIFDADGQAVRYIGTVLDITERKQAEEEIAKLARLPSENPNPILRLDKSGVILYANKASQALLTEWDCKAGERAPKKWQDIVTKVMASRTPRTVETPGQEQVYSFFVVPILESNYVNLYGRDITEVKQAQEKLIASEVRYRRLFEAARDGILILDAETGMVVDVNPFLVNMLGFTPEEFLGKKIWELGFFKDIVASKANFLELQQNEFIRYEDLPLETANGQRKDVEFVSNVYHVDHQKVIQCNIRDISERKRAGEALRESEDKFKYVFDYSSVGKSITQPTGELYVNKAFCEMLGYSPEELKNKRWQELTYPDDIDMNQRELDSVISGEKESARFTKRYLHKDGSILWGDVSTSLRRDQQDKPLYFMTTLVDITERKRAEDALRDSERRLREAQEMAHLGFWRWDIMTGAVEWSEEVFKIFCLDPKEFTPQIDSILAMSPWPEDHQRDKELINRAMETHIPGSYEQKFLRPDQSIGHYYSTFQGNYDENGDLKVIVGTVLDITERKRAEEAQRESEVNFRALAENAGEGILIAGEGGVHLFANPASAKITGYSVDELLQLNARELAHPDEAPQIIERLQKRLAGESIPDHYETFILSKKRLKVPVEINSNKTIWKGQPADIVFIQDITERKRAEEAQQQSELLFRTLFELSPDAIMLIDPHDPDISSRIFDCNTAACQMNGYQRDELIGQSIDMLNAAPYTPTGRIDYLESVREAGNLKLEALHRHKSGTIFPVEVSTKIINVGERELLIGIDRDITERKRAEEELGRTLDELKRSNAELEQFAYVASHDLQEPLRMVSSYVQLLERRYKGKLDQDADEFIGFAVDGSERMQRLINDLLAYSRLGTRGQPFAPVSCENVLGQALDNLQLAIQENKARVTHDPLPEVLADETQLVQLFQNLISNAIKFHGKKKPQVHISAEEKSKEWVFAVRDNGIGIEPQYAERIFIIFQRLNSREKYAGTGIGLAMCKKIVQRHGGRIWIESQPGDGATFYFTLPNTGGERS